MAEKPEAGSQRQGAKAQGAEMGGNAHTQDLDLHTHRRSN